MAKRSAATLARKITIERETVTGRNEFNENVVEWVPFITVHASRRDASDAENFAAGQVGSFLRSRFVIRSSTAARTVTPQDRISYDGSTWNITGVKEADQGDMRGRYIEITAVKDND